MKTELDIVKDVCERLDLARVPYMLTGSLAMNYYAEPRMTRDVDVVVELETSGAARLEALLIADYYVSREAMTEAVSLHSSFDAVHRDSVIKVDFFIRKLEEHRRAEFLREDLILSKLVWARETRSESQQRDVRNLTGAPFDSGNVEKLGESSRFSRSVAVGECMNDTPPEVRELVHRLLMDHSGEERFLMGCQAFESARAMVLASFPPDLAPDELRRRLFARLYGDLPRHLVPEELR